MSNDFFQTLQQGNLNQAKKYLESMSKEDDSIWFRDDSDQSPLHIAAALGDIEIVSSLINLGHPWNAVDINHKSAGEVALENNNLEVYQFLVDEGVRTEFILSILSPKKSQSTYLESKLTYSDDGSILIDSEKNAVMMGWEKPIMELHVKHLMKENPGLSILNIGFGLGIIDKLIQKNNPSRHVIIEAHPDVYQKMISDGWLDKTGVEVFFGKWQGLVLLKNNLDMIEMVGCFDCIFFDTFGEYYDDLKEFHDHLPNLLLDSSSIYSFFNGLAGTNPFFHQVYNKVASADLFEIGLVTEFTTTPLERLGDEVWRNIARPYYSLDYYDLPICKLLD